MTKKILLFGAGYVAPPFVEYMLRRPENFVTIAARTLTSAQKLSAKFPEGKTAPLQLAVTDEAAVDAAVAAHDIVISLIPYTFHALIIKSAVKNKKDFVSTSYISPAMLEHDEAAKAAGVTVMNEIGVDPGVDHVYAMKTIDEVHAKGGKVLSFLSYCGGLPAPESSNNPLGYKFSWSPRGVLLAARNAAKFKENGEIVSIPGPELLRKGPKPIFIYPAFAFEGYPNRDSAPYEQRYNIPEAHTILRGTLRYQGNPRFVLTFADIGLLSDEPQAHLAADAPAQSWLDILGKLLGVAASSEVIQEAIATKAQLTGDEKKRVIHGFKWLGMLSADPADKRGTLLDTLSATLEKKMSFGPGERDMIMLQHKFEIEWADGRKETRTATLLEYGQPDGITAMARTVGVPCGIATQLILDGVINRKGVIAPMTPDVYLPLLKELEAEHITCIEESV
ncbi:saccharopine dehydrogenase [Capsaspora owczarzaki ATCC 30864]|uniref:Saccharopine dehydrogenase n=1 Tax=Capsaspora owczarzaki (strain ATCC 30864) TaxID=595528 RepID=A0A0D2WUZ7_CAPO3|nr:saccharopine dehydrogenase [Capsaspora owczarzaki ATCC 30864]KJE95903.1 saccharopine dehydrogenase [Capsaspora owczarzaki ATCC 30864]|eukprot:XP_011270645.1 saccharopine dehydrogenase [Capsaspora owczarzaki ATCC 30864]